MSGGEQQRVGIARAVVNVHRFHWRMNPPAISTLSHPAEIMRLFGDFGHVGVTVLIATHDLDLIHRFGHHRELVLQHGA